MRRRGGKKTNSYCKVMRTCVSCNCYYCQTQIETHNLPDTGYQLSLCGQTCPGLQIAVGLTPKVIEEVAVAAAVALAEEGGSQKAGVTLSESGSDAHTYLIRERFRVSLEMIRFRITPPLTAAYIYIYIYIYTAHLHDGETENVTFLFRNRVRGRTMGRRRCYCCCYCLFHTVSLWKRLIISYLTEQRSS